MGVWAHGICGCFDDCGTCLFTWLAPCWYQGKKAEATGVGDCLICGLVTFVPLANIWFAAQIRGKIREQRSIEGSLVNDLLTLCCCGLCAMAQENQELGIASPLSQSMARE